MLCMREARERAGRSARRLGAIFFGLVIAACGALLIAHARRTSLDAEPPQPAAALTRVARPLTPAESPAPTAESPAPTAGSPAPTAESPAPAAGSAENRELRARTPSSSELMAALHATPVTMFSTSWCPHCQRARRFFRENGVSVAEHDIDTDARAAAELQRRSGGKSVPLIDVDGRELRGFNEQTTIDAMVASVERRLGVSGVRLTLASTPGRGGSTR